MVRKVIFKNPMSQFWESKCKNCEDRIGEPDIDKDNSKVTIECAKADDCPKLKDFIELEGHNVIIHPY